ncbi:MAG: ATP-dependent DNA ligase [Candidatus Caldarchaeum sp.]|nr:ATP-dependent DNA ligase [Candidatus Caldarchaeum sp.]
MAKKFKELAVLCERLEKTRSRTEKISLVVEFLRSFSSAEFDEAKAVGFLLVGMTSGIRKIGTNVGPSTLFKAYAEKQAPLHDLEPLTVVDVWDTLQKIMKTAGPGSVERRKLLLSNLLIRCDELERKWILRMLTGEMRHGVSAGLLLEALAEYSHLPVEMVRTADMLLADLGELVKKALERKLGDVRLEVFNPLKPMLAEYAYRLEDVRDKLGFPVYIEPKIDGVRVQAHVKNGGIRVFSRGLKDITRSVPDVVEAVQEKVEADSAIIDGEAYCVDEDGRPTRFQETMRRIGREKDVEQALKELRLRVKFFDIIHLNGEDLWSKPLHERRTRLESAVDSSLVNTVVVAENTETIAEKLQDWLKNGYEGLMAKSPESPYTPGRRGGYWLKIKPAQTLDVVVVAAEWGHGRREGWLSNYHLAVLDEKTGQFVPVGKTFKGLTDQEFRKMTELLLSIKTRDTDWGVMVEPRIVLEVEYNEIQRSPHYSSGYALRLARVKAIRLDKQPHEIDTLSTVEKLFHSSRKVFTA